MLNSHFMTLLRSSAFFWVLLISETTIFASILYKEEGVSSRDEYERVSGFKQAVETFVDQTATAIIGTIAEAHLCWVALRGSHAAPALREKPYTFFVSDF